MVRFCNEIDLKKWFTHLHQVKIILVQYLKYWPKTEVCRSWRALLNLIYLTAILHLVDWILFHAISHGQPIVSLWRIQSATIILFYQPANCFHVEKSECHHSRLNFCTNLQQLNLILISVRETTVIIHQHIARYGLWHIACLSQGNNHYPSSK